VIGIPTDEAYAEARPIWADVDLDAITHNLALLRERAGRPVRVLAAIKANAYGHGVEAVARHLQSIGVDGLATANLDDALAARRAGVTRPILMYGSALPGGLEVLLANGLTPSVWSREALLEVSRLAGELGRTIAVHVKVDAGLGRLGVRLDEAAAFAAEVVAAAGVRLEGLYTHLAFGNDEGAEWSSRRLAAFSALVREVEAEHGITIEFAEAAASSILSAGFADSLGTIAPGHLLYGLSPIAGHSAEELGFRKALSALRGRLIHVGRRRVGDDLAGSAPSGLSEDSTIGVVLLGMANGYRAATNGTEAFMLCGRRRCRVLGVSAEYSVIDVSAVPGVAVGDTVTVIGSDGDDAITVETLAEQLGAPSAAYWMIGVHDVPMRYRASSKASAISS
jgi:alanine racemase